MLLKKHNVTIQYMGAKAIQLSATENKKCRFYQCMPEEEGEGYVTHHMLLLDVSGSMSGEMANLKIKVHDTLRALKTIGNQYVSVILYSGHDECYRIVNAVKCDQLSYKMARVYETVDEALYARSITVMSEPLEMAIEIVKVLGDVCDKHHIALFTDGCLVPQRWQVEVEKEKCLRIATFCKEQHIYFNAIGFGKYYDRKFLLDMVQTAQGGTLMHMDKVKSYYETMLKLIQGINKKYIVNTTIHNEDYFVSWHCMRHKEPTKGIYLKGGKGVIVTFDGPLVLDEGEVEETDQQVSDELIEDFMYQLAFYHMLYEDSDSVEIALAATGDIAAYQKLSNCYTFEEKGRALESLEQLIEQPSKRFEKGKVPLRIQTLEEEPLCLLEMLMMILQDKTCKLLWQYEYPYKRIGTKTQLVDEQYRFIRPESGYGEIIDISIGSKKLNIGVKVKIEGVVEEQSTGLRLGANLYRDYNLVVNGNINTTELWCELSKGVASRLRKEKLIKKTIKLKGRTIYVLNLNKIKATNKRMLKVLDQKQLVQELYKVQVLGCQEWAIKQLINALPEAESTLDEEDTFVSDLKKRFHIDSKNIYKPVQVKQDETAPYEVYQATVLEWKIEKFKTKKHQEEALEQYKTYLAAYTGGQEQWLRETLKTVSCEKKYRQDRINLVRLACGLQQKSVFMWDDTYEKQKTETDKVLGMNAVVGGKMQVRTKEVDQLVLREASYKLLTKCN